MDELNSCLSEQGEEWKCHKFLNKFAKSRKCLKLPIISHRLCLEVHRRKLNEQWVKEDWVFFFFSFNNLCRKLGFMQRLGKRRTWMAENCQLRGTGRFPEAPPTTSAAISLSSPSYMAAPRQGMLGKCRLFKLRTPLTPLKFGLFIRKKGEKHILLYTKLMYIKKNCCLCHGHHLHIIWR